MKHIYYLILALVLLSSCTLLQPTPPTPQPYNTTSNQVVANITTNQTNTTPVITEPPKPILVPVNNSLAVYVIDTSVKGSITATYNQHSLLINVPGGADQLRILKIIKNLGIRQLDYLIATNGLEDNIAGFIPILLRTPPKNLIHSGIYSSAPSYNQYTEIFNESTIVPRDDVFAFGDGIVNLIVPYDDGISFTSDNSFVVKISYGNTKILITTDCGIDCESRIDDSDLQSQILVSNGGCDSLTYAFLQDVNPELVIFSQQPCQETKARVDSLAITTLITQTNGDVVVVSDGIKYEYKNLKTRQ